MRCCNIFVFRCARVDLGCLNKKVLPLPLSAPEGLRATQAEAPRLETALEHDLLQRIHFQAGAWYTAGEGCTAVEGHTARRGNTAGEGLDCPCTFAK
jgi:hypothetical protein